GSSEFVKFVQEFLALPVHHYLQVYYQGLVELEDLWGEVAVSDLPGKLPELIPEGKKSLGGFELYRYFLTSGYQETALEHLERQRQVLLAIWSKVGDRHAWGRPRLFKALSPYLETDLSWRELQALQEQFKDYSFSDVQVIHLPGAEEVIHNRLYWGVSYQDINQLGCLLRGEGPAVTEVRVEILNGSGVAGQAASLAEMLTREGLQVVRTGNADHFSYLTTEVIALGEVVEPARIVSSYIEGSVIMHQPDPQAEVDVRVVIGQDYLQAGTGN
ncbi:MAG TPA: LCP family protein, partial [Firmicutes bacterium]|nr:LCP family protein [Bacillota bacterium]